MPRWLWIMARDSTPPKTKTWTQTLKAIHICAIAVAALTWPSNSSLRYAMANTYSSLALKETRVETHSDHSLKMSYKINKTIIIVAATIISDQRFWRKRSNNLKRMGFWLEVPITSLLKKMIKIGPVSSNLRLRMYSRIQVDEEVKVIRWLLYLASEVFSHKINKYHWQVCNLWLI